MESQTISDTELEAKHNHQVEFGGVRCTYEELQKLVTELQVARNCWRTHYYESEKARVKAEELIYEYSVKHDVKFERT